MANQVEIILRLLLAALLGSVIGFERERLSWAAGLRTHMLVCVGSTLIMIVSAYGFSDLLNQPHIELDPSRMAAQVVSGIGFLGAGSILLRGEIIRGLTTAASLWSVAAVGLAVGGGLYTAAIAATVIILIILAGLKPVEKWYFVARQSRALRLIVTRGSLNLHVLEQTIGSSSARVSKFVVQQNEDMADTDEVLIVLSRISDGEFDRVREQLRQVKGLQELSDGRPG